MRQRALRSRLPFTFPLNEEIDHELQPRINTLEKTPSVEVRIPDNTKDDRPMFTSMEILEPNVEEDLYEKIMFKDDHTSVGAIPIPTAFNILQKPAS